MTEGDNGLDALPEQPGEPRPWDRDPWGPQSQGGGGNGGRRFLDMAVAAMVSVLGTILVLWLTIAGKYLTRDEARQMIADTSPWVGERQSVLASISAIAKWNEMTIGDLRGIVRDIEAVKIEQGRTGVKLDEIARRLK